MDSYRKWIRYGYSFEQLFVSRGEIVVIITIMITVDGSCIVFRFDFFSRPRRWRIRIVVGKRPLDRCRTGPKPETARRIRVRCRPRDASFCYAFRTGRDEPQTAARDERRREIASRPETTLSTDTRWIFANTYPTQRSSRRGHPSPGNGATGNRVPLESNVSPGPGPRRLFVATWPR